MLEEKTAIQGDSIGDWLIGHAVNGVDQDISAYTCHLKVEGYVDRDVTAKTGDNLKFIIAISSTESATIPLGNHVIAVTISNGSGFVQHIYGVLTIQSAPTSLVETDIERLTREIAECKAQRLNVAAGNAVVDVWRDGRRVRKNVASLKDLNDLIRLLESELVTAQIAAGVTDTPRRRPIGVLWG